ncbi:atpase synthesis mitochondrial [Fusarium longipes]|uniref:ATPase synthesis protein 25 n=1 Tax=Fusarium longipes TaxID=694270 RepID=A0A395SRI9_9HYPO|nr:atpase synthesis mitochondrial [Fusarium longipes]
MLTRPVAAALSCRHCQSSIIRAVVSRPATSPFRNFPQTSRRFPSPATRFYSDVKTTDPIGEKEASITATPSDISNNSIDISQESDQSGDVPWFLEVEPPRHPESQHAVELPKVPEGAPEVVEPMIKYIFEDMGLDDISVLDLRDLDPPAALGPNLIMLFATARSERHLHISSGRFVRWLRKNHNISARADGLIGPGELRTKLRRLRKKAKLMGTNTAIIPGGDNGISTGWVCVNFSSNGDNVDEAAKVDDTGRFSGFGAPQTGTTVVVQCMTDSRRAELDLETLWKGILKKSLRQNKQARGEKTDSPEELEQLLATKIQLPKSGSALQWQALQNASQQRRAYTTSARRLSTGPVSDRAYHSMPLNSRVTDTIYAQEGITAFSNLHAESNTRTLAEIREWFEGLQLGGLPFTPQMLRRFVRSALVAPAAEPAAKERLSLVDQMLWTAEERGIALWDNAMFTSLIEGLLLSPSYGQPELERAQKNIETIMDRSDCEFNTTELHRMMTYYAKREDWPRFWDTFRKPHLYNSPRSAVLYACAYDTLANTQNQIICIENLRWIYTEMRNETNHISMTGKIYSSLKGCIKVCDPAAEYLLMNGIEYLLRNRYLGEAKEPNHYTLQRFKNREYLNMLREVEMLHDEHTQRGLSN